MTTRNVVGATTRRRQDNSLAILVELAADLTVHRGRTDRAQRLVDHLPRALPCDSVVLLRRDGDALVPVAASGGVPELIGQRFVIAEHPRFTQILRRPALTRFDDLELPDPFDGLVLGGEPLSRIHACVVAPLIVAGDVVGLLALDALDPRAFDAVPDLVFDGLAAVAAAGMCAVGPSDAQAPEPLVKLGAREREPIEPILCQSPAMLAVVREAELAARADLSALITGETGTGKELVARTIHLKSARANRPLIYVNCAALPETVAESELFGHVRGAFTGAIDHRAGKFEVADGGTLFLDEIGELPLSIQAKLLRALQTGEIQRVGSDQPLRVDVRIIAATNRDLEAEIAAGRFRADVYHRLSMYPIEVPPLRERVDDILLLAGIFLDAARIRLGLGSVRLTADARSALLAHAWPGNVRELEHTILRAALRASGDRRRQAVIVDAQALALGRPTTRPNGEGARAVVEDTTPLEQAVEELKRRRIGEALERCDGNWARAARQLGLDRGNLHRLAKRLGLRS